MKKPPKKSATRSASVKAAIAAKPKPEGLSQEDAARLVGCSQGTVSRAIARGDLPTLSNGRLPQESVAILRELRKEDAKVAGETADLERRLLAAQTGEREAKQKLRELELQRESGRFVELDAVQKDAADTREWILSVLRALPQRVAMGVDAALSAPPSRRAAVIEKLIADEVERAIAELAESKYGGGNL